MYTNIHKKNTKNQRKMHTKIFIIKHIENSKNAPPKYNKCKKCTQKLQKSHKDAKNDISGITDILPGPSPYWLSPITNFHHIGYPRYYRDILVPVTHLIPQTSLPTSKCHRQPPRQYGLPTSPSLIFRLVVLMHVSSDLFHTQK
jgi:hypothetical protein